MNMIFFCKRANRCSNRNNLGLEIKSRLAISNRNAVRIFKMCGNHFIEKLSRKFQLLEYCNIFHLTS